MVSSSSVYIILDEVRKSKSMTVDQLCEGIISERTYYRNMNIQKDVKFDVLEKLTDRLGIEPNQLVHYAVFVRTGDPSFTRFMYRVHVKHFSDIKAIYEKVKSHKEPNQFYDRLIDCYIKKYEMMSEIISKQVYLDAIEAHFLEIKDEPLENIFIASIKTFYALEFFDNKDIKIADLLNHYLTYDFRLGFVFYLYALDSLLYAVVGKDDMDPELFKKATEKMYEVLRFFPHKFFHMRYALYQAYVKYLEKDLKQAYHELYKHILNLIVMIGHDDYDIEINKVQKMFNIDVNTFMKDMSQTVLESFK